MLDPEQMVVVTGEEHHQPTLAAWAPRGDGRARRVAAELGFVPGTRGRHVIEVRIDGRRVGTLTALMSERYAPHVQEILRRRERPGCVATVKHGRRGLVEAELYLPDVDGVPAPTPPRPAPRGPDAGRPPAGPRRRLRTPLMIGGGVFALLLVIGAVTGGSSEPDADAVPVVAAAAPTTTRPAPPTTRVTPTPTPTATVEAVAAAPAPTRPVETARAPATRQATTEPQRAPEPAPRPEPEPVRQEAEPEPQSGCDPNYSGCVPIASDVDCEGGSGNGPAYVSGPVRVTGSDIYGLDGNDNDGIGCE